MVGRPFSPRPGPPAPVEQALDAAGLLEERGAQRGDVVEHEHARVGAARREATCRLGLGLGRAPRRACRQLDAVLPLRRPREHERGALPRAHHGVEAAAAPRRAHAARDERAHKVREVVRRRQHNVRAVAPAAVVPRTAEREHPICASSTCREFG
eukprot:79816-Prymnesium_polylepis.1